MPPSPPATSKDRLHQWIRRLIDYMREGMDPGLITAVLFYHWMETMYMDDLLSQELESETIQPLATRLYAYLLENPQPDFDEGSDDPVLASILQTGQRDLWEQVRGMYPRRIFHQRDIQRFTERLSDELDNTMIEVAQWDGHLHRWRPIVFALWWMLKRCMDSVATPPPAPTWGSLQHLEETSRQTVIQWLPSS